MSEVLWLLEFGVSSLRVFKTQVKNPKGPCTQIVYTLALNYSLYRYIGPKVLPIWVHGPSGEYIGIWHVAELRHMALGLWALLQP